MKGSLRKIRGKYVTVIDVGPNPQTGNRRQQKRVHKTEAAAEAHLATMLAQVQSDEYVPLTKVRTGEFLARWLRGYENPTVSPLTLRGYRDATAKLTHALGAIPLRRLAPTDVQRFKTEEMARGQSPATVHATLRALRTALEQAVREGLVSRNVATLVPLPRLRRRRPPIWQDEDLTLFIGAARRESVRYPLFLTAIGTGMRLGELLGLRWHIDWATQSLRVQQTFYRLGAGTWLWRDPKTESSRRTVALGPEVLDVLRQVERTQAEQKRLLGPDYHNHDLVFCQPNGNPLHAHNLTQRELRRICAIAGVPRLRFHDLRHLHATYLALAGIPVKVAQERLGHSSARVTQDIYQHVLSGQQQQAALDVEAALFKGTAKEVSK
jgi:integrase